MRWVLTEIAILFQLFSSSVAFLFIFMYARQVSIQVVPVRTWAAWPPEFYFYFCNFSPKKKTKQKKTKQKRKNLFLFYSLLYGKKMNSHGPFFVCFTSGEMASQWLDMLSSQITRFCFIFQIILNSSCDLVLINQPITSFFLTRS